LPTYKRLSDACQHDQRRPSGAIAFRGFTPTTRDELVTAFGDQITVQDCATRSRRTDQQKPFNDVRMRCALTL
jgi:hypothetical protein